MTNPFKFPSVEPYLKFVTEHPYQFLQNVIEILVPKLENAHLNHHYHPEGLVNGLKPKRNPEKLSFGPPSRSTNPVSAHSSLNAIDYPKSVLELSDKFLNVEALPAYLESVDQCLKDYSVRKHPLFIPSNQHPTHFETLRKLKKLRTALFHIIARTQFLNQHTLPEPHEFTRYAEKYGRFFSSSIVSELKNQDEQWKQLLQSRQPEPQLSQHLDSETSEILSKRKTLLNKSFYPILNSFYQHMVKLNQDITHFNPQYALNLNEGDNKQNINCPSEMDTYQFELIIKTRVNFQVYQQLTHLANQYCNNATMAFSGFKYRFREILQGKVQILCNNQPLTYDVSTVLSNQRDKWGFKNFMERLSEIIGWTFGIHFFKPHSFYLLSELNKSTENTQEFGM